jgi:tetratricopeptide (TPR) repeat protein
VKTLFLIYQLATGEEIAEAALRAALGDGARICEFRVDADCCGSLACKRASEFDRAGYQLFVQRATDDGTLDVPKSGELTVVLQREPTRRALDLYRRGGTQRPALQSFLANEALRTVDFRRKWGATPRHVFVHVETLAASPRETLDELLSEAGVRPDGGGLAPIADLPDATLGAFEADPDFQRPFFGEFMDLLAEEVDYLGYPLWQARRPASGPITTMYRARRALADGRFDEAIANLGAFVAVNGAEPEVRALLGQALLEAGREVEGRRALDGLIKSHPDNFDAYGILARHAHRLGLAIEFRGILREAMSRKGGAEWVRCFLLKNKIETDLLRELPPAPVEPPVSRPSVVAGFTWILGRKPESDAVIEGHRHLHDDDELRMTLLRSQEFREFRERFEAGMEHAPEEGAGVTREDLLQALRWLLNRPLRSRAEADDLLGSASPPALRLRLLGEEEFAQSWRHIAETL